MLDKIKSLVSEYAGDAIFKNPAVPDSKNHEVVDDASMSIVNGLKSAASNGNVDELTAMFNNGADAAASSPITKNIESGFLQNLIHKFGLDQQKAGGIASLLIPMVMKKLVHKTNDSTDNSFNLTEILSSLAASTSAGSILSSATGKDSGAFWAK